MKYAALAGAFAFACILACPQKGPDIPTYRTSLEELKPYFASYLWVDENAIDDNMITRVNICRGQNGLEHLTEQDEMKNATAFTLLTGTLPELNPIVIEYAQRASQANCPPNDVDCLRDAFRDILDDGRFQELICGAEEEYNNYVTELVSGDVSGTQPNPKLIYTIRDTLMQEKYGQAPEKPTGVFYLYVCE